ERVSVTYADAAAAALSDVSLVVEEGELCLVVGPTGSGKSTLLATLALADARAGRGLVVIDPKGDLVRDITERLPPDARGRLVVIDPDAPQPWPTLNALDGPDPDLVADHVVGIFHRIYAAWWGPRTDDVLRAAVLTLLHPANRARPDIAHLGSVPRLLTEDPFRRRISAPAAGEDPILRGFWSWYDGLSEAARAQVTGPVMNKLRAVLLRRFARATLANGQSTLDMNRILDRGICLVRIPKGTLGADTCRLLGSFVLARAWQTATNRARTGEPHRRDAAIVLDEAHNFLTLPHSIEDMLAEARAYRISLVLAHQNLAQLPRELKEGISANARNKVFFTCSPEDAAALERHVTPTLTAHDLAHLEEFQAATRLIVAARPAPACTLRTRALPESGQRAARRAA
ncbi:MAG TPA: TraM recognition domain-containing protein, partial [Mycobacteriales bacterium]|nr:TraM recognition domain-containing protein [Mycobacteriales bacterium]